jgi:selenocysteine lyase/cysteine desulfurase
MEWAKWRAEFPACATGVHMNHAGLAPVSRRVADAMRRFANEALLGDDAHADGWSARAESVRAAAARLLGAQPAEIAFVQNTSAGLSLIAAGLDWRAGDNVVALADEYPANIYPWWGLRRFGVQTRLVARPQSRFGVDDIRPLVDGRTRLVAISAVDWQSGFRADWAAVAEFCRARDLVCVVDAIQALGALQIDVAKSGIDCLAAGGHKWLLAPEGCGVLFVAPRLIERVHPVLLGWKSVREADRYLPYHFDLRSDAARLEPGSPPHLGIHALGAALELLLEVGPARIERRVLAITERLADGLRARAASIVSPWGPHERSGILTFQLGEPSALVAVLARAGVMARVRAGGVRLAPHFYTNEDDVARVLDAVDAYRAGAG